MRYMHEFIQYVYLYNIYIYLIHVHLYFIDSQYLWIPLFETVDSFSLTFLNIFVGFPSHFSEPFQGNHADHERNVSEEGQKAQC